MGTSADKLNKLIQTKADIKNAIIEKGGVVNDSTPFGDYAQAIRDIEGGGGGGTPTLKLNWNHWSDPPVYSSFTDCASGGILSGVMNTGAVGGQSGTSYIYKVYENLPDNITSAKFIVCASPTNYTSWNNQGCALAVWKDGDAGEKIVLQAQGATACYWNGHTETWGQTDINVQTNNYTGCYAGTDVIWWVYEFDGTNNYMYAIREKDGALNPSDNIYPLTYEGEINKTNVGEGTGVNGSFIGSSMRLFIGGEAKDENNNTNQSPYAGNIDLLRCRLFINDEELERPMEIVGKANINTYLLNGTSNSLLNNVSVYPRSGYDDYAKALDLNDVDSAFLEPFADEDWYILSFKTVNPVIINNVVEVGRPAYVHDNSMTSPPFKLYGSNSPLNEDNFKSGTLVGTGGEGVYTSVYNKFGFKYYALSIGRDSGVAQQYSMKFLITVQEKVAEKAGERFRLNAQFCGSQEGSYPLSNASDGDFETWWSHDSGSSAEPYIAFQIPELPIASSDKVKILASFYNTWNEHPTNLTVKAVSQEDMAMVQAGIMGIDWVGTTLTTIDQELPSSKDLVKLTNYFEYSQVKNKLIVLRANSMSSGSFKVAEARIEVEPKEE